VRSNMTGIRLYKQMFPYSWQGSGMRDRVADEIGVRVAVVIWDAVNRSLFFDFNARLLGPVESGVFHHFRSGSH
jgi:hypothetical protein